MKTLKLSFKATSFLKTSKEYVSLLSKLILDTIVPAMRSDQNYPSEIVKLRDQVNRIYSEVSLLLFLNKSCID